MSLVPRGAYTLSDALQKTNKPTTVLYNEGEAFFQPNANQNIAIYNAPGGNITFLSPIKCKHCEKEFNSISEREQHYEDYTKTCSQHKVCFDRWTSHVNNSSHTKCPFPGCQKTGVNFGSNARFVQHFRNKHYI